MAATVTSSESNRAIGAAQLAQVNDAVLAAGYKWFSLQDNKLDGSFHPLELGSASQVGWWGSSLSVAGGVLSVPPTLTITETRPIHSLALSGDSLLGEFPVDFAIRLYNGASLLYTETVTGNAAVNWSKNLSAVYDVTHITITVSKVNKAGRVAKVVDAFSPFVVSRVDSIKVKQDAQVSVATLVASSDIVKLSYLESKIANATLASTDLLKVNTSDSKLFTLYEVWRNDTLNTNLLEGELLSVTLSSTDTANCNVSGTVSLVASLSSSDVVSSALSELHEVQANLTRQDTLVTNTADISTPVVASISSIDSLLLKESSTKDITAYLLSADAIKAFTTSTEAITAFLDRSDVTLISSNLEDDIITASFSSYDTLSIATSDESLLTNVHSRMNETFRKTYAKVEITYTDPFQDDKVVVTASSTANGTDAKQLADNIEEPALKWFSLSDNKLDGSSSPISEGYSVGWWSEELSDAGGTFSTPPVVTVVFQQRAVYTLKVVGDSKHNNYPVDFAIRCYNAANDLLYERIVVDNNKLNWRQDIEPVIGVSTMTVTISKINKAHDNAKLTEVYTAIVETYDEASLIDLSLLEETAYPSGSVALGATSANEIDVTFNNANGKFNFGNTQSPLHGLMKRNRRLKAWFGVEVIPGEVEWHDLGTFWTIGWDVQDSSLEARTTARDRLELLRMTDFVKSVVYTDISIYDLYVVVLSDAGLKHTEYALDDSLKNLVVPYAWFDRMTHREALQRITSCVYVNMFCDRQGRIVVQKPNIDPAAQPYFTLDNDTNIYSKSYPINATAVTNYVEVVSEPRFLQAPSEVVSIKEVLTIPANSSINMSCSFSEVPSINPVVPDIPGVTSLVVAYAWGIELTLTNTTGTDVVLQELSILGSVVAKSSKTFTVSKDDNLIRDNGKLSTTISHEFIQTTTFANGLASEVLQAYRQSMYDVSVETRGNIALHLGERVRLVDNKMLTDYSYLVQRQTLRWNGVLSATLDGKKV